MSLVSFVRGGAAQTTSGFIPWSKYNFPSAVHVLRTVPCYLVDTTAIFYEDKVNLCVDRLEWASPTEPSRSGQTLHLACLAVRNEDQVRTEGGY